MANQIPNSIIGIVAESLSLQKVYDHKKLDRLFLKCGGISVEAFEGDEYDKIKHGLDLINKNAQDPLAILGKLLKDYMETDFFKKTDELFSDNKAKQQRENRDHIQTALRNKGFSYSSGGIIAPLVLTAQPVQTLADQIAEQGLSPVQREIERAMQDLDNDLPSAMHRAENLMEAVYKAYLAKNGVRYSNSAKAPELWREVKTRLELNPTTQANAQLRDIASSLNNMAQAILELRNHIGASHGKDDAQYIQSQAITRSQAHLAVNAAATLSYYILEA